MNIQQGVDRFFIGEDGNKPLAQIVYEPGPDKVLNVVHTFTDDSLRGQGIARRLVDHLANYARETGHRLRATCPYAHKVLSEAAYQDVFAG